MAGRNDTRIIRKTSRQNILPRIVIGLVIVIALASALAIYFKQEEQKARIDAERIRLDQELAEAQMRFDELRNMEALVGTDTFTEWVARNRLGMVRPDEIILSDE
ncbi:MAG: hypothetical protein GX749_00885 [Ruminococcaceae bacterium]|nr:hypothetical protein [Oscillospiraceae bacterium]